MKRKQPLDVTAVVTKKESTKYASANSELDLGSKPSRSSRK